MLSSSGSFHGDTVGIAMEGMHVPQGHPSVLCRLVVLGEQLGLKEIC